MIDPSIITNYNLNDYELQEVIIFWLLVAGKTAKVVAQQLDNLLQKIDNHPYHPFEAFRNYSGDLPELLKKHGIGCYNGKARGIKELVNSNLNLRTCSVEELEEITFIGPKTARCFIVHSRENARYACLDTHCLKFLRSRGFDVPKSTPTGRKYRELEQVFLTLADKSGMTPAAFDLKIWNEYSKG